MYEIISQGKHLVNIGEYVEAWILENHCFILEDKELVAGFKYEDKEDKQLMEYACLLYHKNVATSRTKH